MRAEQSIFPSAEEWTKHHIAFTLDTDSVAEVGIAVDSPAIYGMVKEICLVSEQCRQ